MRSMVVLHRAYGFRFVIYTADHEPAHIHITGAGHAKFDLAGPDGRPETVFVIGITRRDMTRLMAEVEARQGEFLRAWRRFHGPHH